MQVEVQLYGITKSSGELSVTAQLWALPGAPSTVNLLSATGSQGSSCCKGRWRVSLCLQLVSDPSHVAGFLFHACVHANKMTIAKHKMGRAAVRNFLSSMLKTGERINRRRANPL